jgi:hypothetical protein
MLRTIQSNSSVSSFRIDLPVEIVPVITGNFCSH